jgi:dTDP-4-dehydrorhamnose reductase
VSDQAGAPTLSGEIAGATAKVIADVTGGKNGLRAEVSGIYHMTAGGKTTWYDLAVAILERAAAASPNQPWLAAATGGLPLIARRVIPITTSDYLTPARRPAYSVLSNARLNRTFSVQLPDWQKQLDSIFANPPATTR